ncbi:MAG: CSLREA domain-containing protein [Caldilinea sp. CFX5]|nr:CSLREA domain-containing protein [Caldilinea sp. CFX5]
MQTQFVHGIRNNASWRMGLIALFVAVLIGLAAPQPALAATFTVTKPADTNDGACNADCSLREAIIAANAAPGADVITLPAGTYTLSRSGVDNTAANGDLDVTGPLTINGAAQATTIIQAGASSPTAIDRVFSFNPLGTATGFAVSLNNLTIRNGKNPNAFATQENDGGCFDFDGGTAGAGSLSLTSVTVSNCETTDGSGGGAAIFLPHGGTINFSGATIQNNIASRGGNNFGDGGGLIFSCVQSGGTSTVTIANSTISGNSTRSLGGNNSGSGGGIVNFGVCTPGTATASMQLHAVTISGNSTGNDGGGIYSGGALVIDNVGGPSVISNNSAGRSGGGIWLNHPNTTSTISKVTFSGNSAGDAGGAIRLDSSRPGNALNVSFSRFVNNTAASGKASALSVYNGDAIVSNNWWGCSTGPSAAPCDTAKLDPASGTTGPLGTGTLNFTPWLRLNLTAATNPLVTGQSTGLTASFLTDSSGGAVALSNLTLLLGQPVTWSGVGGTISGQQTTIQANGTATANYQATAAAAGNQAVAKVDNDGMTTGSNVRAITVNKANTTATITADTPDPSVSGQPVAVNYNVTVNAPGAGTPTGNVTVSDGVNSCTGTVAAGTCNISLSTVGARTLTATYAGDSNFTDSTSAGAAHTVTTATQAPQITTQPTNQSVCAGATATFSAAANGTPAPTVQWQVSSDNSATWNDLSGETNATLSVVTSAADNGKQYRALFTNSAGSATTDAATLTVNRAPAISMQPSSQTVNEGQSVSFSAAASDSPAPTVQWQVSSDNGATWNDLNGATNATLTFTAQSGDNGKQYRAFFSNSCGTTTTNTATLTVNTLPPPDTTAPDTTIDSQPAQPSNSSSASFTFSGTDNVTPAASLTFECSLDGAAFAACTSPQNYSALTDGSHTFQVRAKDAAGNVDATPASYTWTINTASGNLFIASCGGYDVYRTPQGQYTAAGWSGAILVGTASSNTLNGGSGPDLILGLGGNDSLRGNGGDDVLCGGDGVDLVQGHAGNDYLDGGNGSDALNGGSGDYDTLLAGDGNDALLDGDGVNNASGGAGSDTFALALRPGWRDLNGQARFAGLAAGYGNDTVGLAILDPVAFFVDITGDERDNPPSPFEGTNDTLALIGVIDPASTIIKFEQQVILSATATPTIPGEESGTEYLSEPVGDEAATPIGQANRIFLPLVNR